MRLWVTILTLLLFLQQHFLCCCQTGCGVGVDNASCGTQACECGHNHDGAHELGASLDLAGLTGETHASSPVPRDHHHICIGTHLFFVSSAPASIDALDWDFAWIPVAILPVASSESMELFCHNLDRQSVGKFSSAAELRAHLGVYRI